MCTMNRNLHYFCVGAMNKCQKKHILDKANKIVEQQNTIKY